MGQQIRDGFTVNAPSNEIKFNRFSDVQNGDRAGLFFQLPPKFRGDQVGAQISVKLLTRKVATRYVGKQSGSSLDMLPNIAGEM